MERGRRLVLLATAALAMAATSGAQDCVTVGFAAGTTGGAGHPVVYVTTLADNAPYTPNIPGSLRAALAGGGNRTVRFQVSGNIQLRQELFVRYPNVTIDGSTAPNGGVALWGNQLVVRTDNVVIRHLRFRGSHPTALVDGIQIEGGRGILIDHVSCSWASDECISLIGYSYRSTGRVRDVTIQHSLIAEPPANHPYAMLVDGDVADVTWYRNVFAKNAARNPQITTGRRQDQGGTSGLQISGLGRYELVQNVVYDAVYVTRLLNLGATWTMGVDVIGNLWLTGPDWPKPRTPIEIFAYPVSLGTIRVYLRDNEGPSRPNDTGSDCDYFSLEQLGTPCGGWAPAHSATAPFAPEHVFPGARAALAFDQILAEAGATRPCRDSADRRIVAELRAGVSSPVPSPAVFPDLTRPCP